MSTIDRTPTGGFEERLLAQLKAHIAAQPMPAVATSIRRRPRALLPSLRTSLATAVTAAAAIVVGLLSTLSGAESALARTFPILTHRPQRLPASMQQVLVSSQLAAEGYRPDHDRAYAFPTGAGTGYVVVDQRTDWLCILVPEPGAHGASIRCETTSWLLTHKSRGLELTESRGAEHKLVWLLPEGSIATTGANHQNARRAQLRDGVLAIVSRQPITVTTSFHGRRTTITYGTL